MKLVEIYVSKYATADDGFSFFGSPLIEEFFPVFAQPFGKPSRIEETPVASAMTTDLGIVKSSY